MATITVLDKPTAKRIRVEIDADKLEKLAASLGFLIPILLIVWRGRRKITKPAE